MFDIRPRAHGACFYVLGPYVFVSGSPNKALLRPGDIGALEAFVSIISGPPGPRPEQLLERICAPVLVLWGDRDTFTPIDGPVGRFFQRLPESRERTKLQILPGAGLHTADTNADVLSVTCLRAVPHLRVMSLSTGLDSSFDG